MDEQKPEMQIEEEVVEKNTSQKVIIGSVAALLLLSVGLYFSGFSFRKFFFGDSGESGEKIALVLQVQGQLKRQPKDSLEFLPSQEKSDLYNEDTVMTGGEDTARLELFDGSILELDPGSLIRLSFDSSFALGGVDRRVLVEVVSGNVKSQLKREDSIIIRKVQTLDKGAKRAAPPPAPPSPPPAPPPSPTPVYKPVKTPPKIVMPKLGETLKVSVGARPPVRAAVAFEAPDSPDGEFLLTLRSKAGQVVFNDKVKLENGKAQIEHEFESPGDYTAEVANPDGSPLGDQGMKHPFKIDKEFIGIEVETPLVAGKKIESNRLQGKRIKKFDAVLRWKGYKGIKRYQVDIRDLSDKLIMSKWVEGEEFTLPPTLSAGKPFTYKIKGRFKGGYIVTSEKTHFGFNFLSPQLTLPKNNFIASAAQVSKSKKSGVLFTWQSTNFTEKYEFEIATDPKFQRVQKSIQIKENFLIYRNLKPGHYFWRVRSMAGNMRSKPGQVFSINITQ